MSAKSKFFFSRRSHSYSEFNFWKFEVRYFQERLSMRRRIFDALNAATLEDLLVLTYVRSKNHSLPKKTLYIALDPWMMKCLMDMLIGSRFLCQIILFLQWHIWF